MMINEEAEGVTSRLRALRQALREAATAIQNSSLTQRQRAELAERWRRIASG